MKIGNTKFKKHPTMPGFWIAGGFGSDDVIEQRARAINALQLADGCTAVCGRKDEDDSYLLYLVPHSNPVDVARFFKVGSCGGYSDCDDSAEALKVIDLVNRKAEIVPYFADTNGFKFVFRDGLDFSLPAFLEKVITVGAEAMMDAEGKIGSTILGRGFVHLWWD